MRHAWSVEDAVRMLPRRRAAAACLRRAEEEGVESACGGAVRVPGGVYVVRMWDTVGVV